MKSGKFSLFTFLAISMVCSLVAAQQGATTPSSATVPRLVNFSGKTADAQGKAIFGIAGVTFAIYKDQYEGAPLWLETQNVQADAKGSYTVQLGATNPDGLPLDLFSSGDARWLGVTVNGGQEQLRVLLLSVPYALKAADAETIGGLPPSAFVLANKATGTGMSAKPAAAAPSAARKNAVPPANPAVTGVGTLDFIPMWDSTSDIINSLIFQKSSQIGINTTAPAATLDVNGKGDVRDTLTLFPKGTDSTLAINGTTFKVDQTGKVTFISGQTFPGTGTVTSVGLSAPSSDFKVTGSPVTKTGTLGLNWKVAPTSSNTVNAIVKRDGTGSFSASAITANDVVATNTSTALLGTMTSNSAVGAVTGAATATGAGPTYGLMGITSTTAGAGVLGQTTNGGYGVSGIATGTSGQGVRGEAFGTQGSNFLGPDGVDGFSHADGASGVGGFNTANGYGVYGSGGAYGLYGTSFGTNGVGVYGTGTNAFWADGNTHQSRAAGGWVKAMVYVNGQNAPYTILRCFNSTLAGAAATTVPCGFTLTELAIGSWQVDFGFGVNDRFISLSFGANGYASQGGVCTSSDGCLFNLDANTLVVETFDNSGLNNAMFYLIVY